MEVGKIDSKLAVGKAILLNWWKASWVVVLGLRNQSCAEFAKKPVLCTYWYSAWRWFVDRQAIAATLVESRNKCASRWG